MSVAIWSLRLRPARSLPPSSGPTVATSSRSRAECTSSSLSSGRMTPSLHPGLDHAERGQHPLELLRGQVAGRGERPGVRPRAGEVVGRELPVEVRRAAERDEFGRRSVGEPSAPEGAALGLRHAYSPDDRSRRAEIFDGSDQISMKPLACDWSKVSPVS